MAIQGFYVSNLAQLRIRDTVVASLRQNTAPFSVIQSIKGVIDSITFQGQFDFGSIAPGNYYLSIITRNGVESWSSAPLSIGSGDTLAYDFTTTANKTYGNNVILKGSTYCFYSGDVNQDGVVGSSDIAQIYTDIYNFSEGYVASDITGDGVVDNEDLLIVYNNASNFITRIIP